MKMLDQPEWKKEHDKLYEDYSVLIDNYNELNEKLLKYRAAIQELKIAFSDYEYDALESSLEEFFNTVEQL